MSRKKLVILTSVVLVVGFLGWKIAFPAKTAVTYQTTPVQQGTLVTSVSASGTISSGNSLDITSSATGVVSRVYVKVGDHVAAGQKIADISLDQASQQRQIAAWSGYLSAKNQLASAQANLNSLQATEFTANQKFINDAVARGLATDDPTYIEENASWLQAQANYVDQSQVISQARAAVQSAWLSYEQISPIVTSPTGGVVTSLVLAPGLAITAPASTGSSNTVTASVVGSVSPQASQTQAVVNVSEIDSVSVQPGQKVTLTLDAFPNQTFTGTVLVVNTTGTVSSGVTTYPTTIALDNSPAHVYPNMDVTAQIITSVKDHVLLVPSSAVTAVNGTNQVKILVNGQPQTVDVGVGGSNATQTEITSGLTADENVITNSLSGSGSAQSGNTSPFSPLGRGGFGGGARAFGR